MDFKCLFCQDPLKDGDLVCTTSCQDLIHEWCVEQMKAANDHQCKNCKNIIAVYSNFREFDLCKAVTIVSMKVIIQKLDEMIILIKSRESVINEITKNHEEISDKIEGLSIEHHALKEIVEKRLNKLEDKSIHKDV